jgi:uncharacterized protein YdhG (YjbR/CyaY superfamily)
MKRPARARSSASSNRSKTRASPDDASGRKQVDRYLAGLSPELRPVLEELRRTLRDAAPGAEEVISYRMPAFRQNGMLVYYAGFRDHGSLFVADRDLLRKHARELKPFRTGRGTLRFTPERPIPKALVRTLVRERVRENEARAKRVRARPS